MPIYTAATPTPPGPGFPGGETVSIVTAGTVADPYSTETSESWADADVTYVDVDGVLCEPRPSMEPVQDARNAVTSGWTLYFPAGSPVTAANRVVVRGEMYPVQGEPADWRAGSWQAGIVVQAYKTEG